jgi:alginate O-acetyltransferase complex protein AlgI
MLFSSPAFIVLFLPITLLIFFQIGGRGYFRLALVWLLAASFVFYANWNPANLLLLLVSILLNYGIGTTLAQVAQPKLKKFLLVLGIAINLALIGYFKYANFFISTIANALHTNYSPIDVLLPLGISFFTFQQIIYLVDTYRAPQQQPYRLLDYSLFVAFFPQLIAGPLVHHRQLIDQFAHKVSFRFNPENLALGITIFAIGLFKKVIFADGIALYSTQAFAAATDGVALTIVEAWIGALAFTLQLYFDFSGYSDMAIGLGRMFGIQLPINFNSPYKAVNIIDFWRRWHITLSDFLRDYLYIPLGGNRKGEIRRNINLLITMLLGGLWHGAGWTFVVWGGLHGLYLMLNHQWRRLRQRVWNHDLSASNFWAREGSWLLTFVAVVIGWVFFKAENLAVAFSVLKSMAGFNGISLPDWLESPLGFMQAWGVQFNNLMPNLQFEVEQLDDVNELEPIVPIVKIIVLLLLVRLAPNTQQWLAHWSAAKTAIGQAASVKAHWQLLSWRPNRFWAVISAVVTAIALLNLAQVSEFLYFEF